MRGAHTPRVCVCARVAHTMRMCTFMFPWKGELFSCRFAGFLCLPRLSLFLFPLLSFSLPPLCSLPSLMTSLSLSLLFLFFLFLSFSYTFFLASLSFAENRGGKNVGDFQAAFRGFSFSSRDARHEDTASLRDRVRSVGDRVDQGSYICEIIHHRLVIVRGWIHVPFGKNFFLFASSIRGKRFRDDHSTMIRRPWWHINEKTFSSKLWTKELVCQARMKSACSSRAGGQGGLNYFRRSSARRKNERVCRIAGITKRINGNTALPASRWDAGNRRESNHARSCTECERISSSVRSALEKNAQRRIAGTIVPPRARHRCVSAPCKRCRHLVLYRPLNQ